MFSFKNTFANIIPNIEDVENNNINEFTDYILEVSSLQKNIITFFYITK